MKRYSEYKESENLEQTPKEWKFERLHSICDFVRGNSAFQKDDLSSMGDYIALQYGKTYKVEKVDNTFQFYVDKKFYKSSQKVVYDDVIFVSTSETVEDLGHAVHYTRRDIGLVGSEQILLKPNRNELNGNYLFYSTRNFGGKLAGLSKGLKVFRFNIDDLKTISISFPEINEQKAIANYLDRETEKIDKKVSVLEKKAGLYKELKQSLINETVTRGLPPEEAHKAGLTSNPPMKDSGIPWIGEIPEHWEIKRIGSAFEQRSDKVNDTDYPPLSVTMKGIVPQLDSAAKTQHNDNRRKVLKGDYVINSRSDRRGSSGVSPYDGSVSVINIVLKPLNKFEGAYLHYLFRSYRFIEEFYRNGRGIVDDLWTTKYDFMRAIECSFPSNTEEQQAIATYLDRKTSQIDNILISIDKQTLTLKELRKTLVNDVVTGKICVTDTL